MSGIPKSNRTDTADGIHVCSLPFGQKKQTGLYLQSICLFISAGYVDRLMMIMQCETSEGKPLLLNSSEVSSQVDFLVFQAELASDLVTMGYNGMGGEVQDVCDFLGLFSFFY